MFIFSPYTYTVVMAGLLFSITGSFLQAFSSLSIQASSLVITISPFILSQVGFDVSLLLRPISCLFSAVVSFISGVVFLFIRIYFQKWNKLTYFCWYTIAFVLCILILINFNDFFFLILGWDGLGVSSFFLILYFQSPSRVYSGTITILINRLGDCFLVLFIIIWWGLRVNTHFILESNISNSYVAFLLFISLSTKSALFPFSPWLPAAMAAPTPISSLVHSSTLVTAGLFLLIQNSSILTNYSLCYFILITSIFTSLYAGISALLESDLKKVVALSTLSHLGFIGIAISLSLPYLAFFHLLAHALFKSSLFISIGTFIVSHGHYQDSRLITSAYNYNPYFRSVILVSEANLLGLPFLSGFYSKDLILEFSQYSQVGSLLRLVLFTNVLLTFSYTLRILLSLSQKNNNNSFSLSLSSSLSPSTRPFLLSLSILSLSSVRFGLFFSKTLLNIEVSVPPLLKLAPVVLLLCIVTFFLLIDSMFLSKKGKPFSYFVSSLFFLTPLWANSTSQTFIRYSNKILYLEESFIKSLLIFFFQIVLKFSSNLFTHILTGSITSRSKVYWVVFVVFLVLFSMWDTL